MKAEVRGQRTAVREQRSEVSSRGFGFGVLVVLVAAVAAPVFAHGCHAGDHDDEPAAAPTEQRSGSAPDR
ncbi:MAG: hypothetical protein K2P78_05350 [Gemmataceae bacterium]|nr:hypothetical protein [Gemmataceae bacterium]